MRHDSEAMPKKSALVMFPNLIDTIRGICRNKESFSVDIMENTHTGEKRWGLVFYVIKSKLLAYCRLDSKDPTKSLALYALGKFIAEHGIPIVLIMYSEGILGAGYKWKQAIGKTFIPLHLSGPDKHNQNPVKRFTQNLKARCSKISNSCGTGILPYHY